GKTILSDVSFEIKPGEMVALLGPNGAGKTSILKCITGLWQKTSGYIKFQDEELGDSNSNIVFIPEKFNFINSLSGYSNLIYFLKFANVNIDNLLVKEVFTKLQIYDRLNDMVKTYSMGMKQRLMLGLAVLRGSKFIILDEPTNGLDATGIVTLRNTLKELNNAGLTILISSHILSEMQQLCNKFIFISKGVIVKIIEKEELFTQIERKEHIVVTFGTDTDLLTIIELLTNSGFNAEIVDNKIHIYTPKSNMQTLSKLFSDNNLFYSDLNIFEERLEDIYLELN
ncbi:MAG: ABC transporter ATP-binding protein, partial [Christensenellaceae bacterium]|nr:ABC transporter ATP-binding protein [Christensenellaceae bacterium]